MNTGKRTCIVTGSASGIGTATVMALAADGYDTFGIDLNGAGAQEVALQASQACPDTRHGAAQSDVADEADLIKAFDAALLFLGTLDALVTSAGVVDTTPFMDITVAQFRRIHDVNVVGTWLSMREAARRMQAGGVICAIASIAGLRGGGLSGTAAYAASKGGVISLAKKTRRACWRRKVSG